MPEHMTIAQWIYMAIVHAGPPTVAILLAYLKLRANQSEHAERIIVQLNGNMEQRIKIVESKLDELTKPKHDPAGEES